MGRVLIADLDTNDAPPFRHEVASFQVLVGGTASLNVQLLIDRVISPQKIPQITNNN